MKAVLAHDYEQAYQFISSVDRNARPLDQYLELVSQERAEMKLEGCSSKINDKIRILFERGLSYRISSVEVSGNVAKVKCEFISPDLSEVYNYYDEQQKLARKRVEAQRIESGASPTDAYLDSLKLPKKCNEEEILKLLREKFEDKVPPIKKSESLYNLVRESDEWRVFFDWATEKKVKTLAEEVEKLTERGDLKAAREKYGELLSLKPEQFLSSFEVDTLGENIERKAYLDKVVVRNVSVDRIPMFAILDRAVRGEVKNIGEKSLARITLKLYFLDKNGKRIYEKEYNIYSGSDPLRPNYSKSFYELSHDVPSEWTGKVEITVTDVEFHNSVMDRYLNPTAGTEK